MAERPENTFERLLLGTDTFAVTCEHIPGRVSRDKKLDDILAFAEKCRDTGLVHALSLTDNPGGTPSISPDGLAAEIERIGLPAIVHFPAKDMNRNLIESRALALDRTGIRNLLVMSGDFPALGQMGLPMPVFDLDPVHVLTMLTLMNRGLRVNFADHTVEEGPKTCFFHGAVVSPFKFTEPEMMMQLSKMEMKARAGARFFVTQLGYDTKKLRNFRAWTMEKSITVPVLGSVFILRKGAAAMMNRGEVPGSFVDDRLFHEIAAEAEAEDKGRAASLERAAMQVAVLMGLGFRGAHIEAMVLTFPMVEDILRRAAELRPNWEECAEKLDYSPAGAFYLGGTGATAASPASRKLRKGFFLYRCMCHTHDIAFVKDGFFGPVMRAFCRVLDRVKWLGALSHFGEYVIKKILFDCRDCGDCALPELHYLCPQSQCPKQERNGPCGGSRLDACEVHPDRPCVWTRVYTRAKAFHTLDDVRNTIIGPRDWRLDGTSGWVNFHLDRDHAAYDFARYFSAEKPDGENA